MIKRLFTPRVLSRYEAPRIPVTPDPAQAAELERRRKELTYQPENGFLCDLGVDQVLNSRKVK